MSEQSSQSGLARVKEMLNAKWDLRFMRIAEEMAGWSKDPRRKVGCVIVDNKRNQLSGGYNGLPRGIADTQARLEDRDQKLLLTVHAEANAVAAAARNGHSLAGGIAYVTSPLCCQCAALFVQAGIYRVVYRELEQCSPDWIPNHAAALEMLAEASVQVTKL